MLDKVGVLVYDIDSDRDKRRTKMNVDMARAELRHIARVAAAAMENDPQAEYGTARCENIFVEVDREYDVWVAIMTPRGEYIATTLTQAVAVLSWCGISSRYQ
jgi:hypothetical protein